MSERRQVSHTEPTGALISGMNACRARPIRPANQTEQANAHFPRRPHPRRFPVDACRLERGSRLLDFRGQGRSRQRRPPHKVQAQADLLIDPKSMRAKPAHAAPVAVRRAQQLNVGKNFLPIRPERAYPPDGRLMTWVALPLSPRRPFTGSAPACTARWGFVLLSSGNQKLIWPAKPIRAASKARPENNQVKVASPLRFPVLRRGMTSPVVASTRNSSRSNLSMEDTSSASTAKQAMSRVSPMRWLLTFLLALV